LAEQQHRSDPRVLNERTLHHDFRRLAELVRPGMRVLDVGCGTGAMTAGIADLVGLNGEVTGLDRDAPLLEQARARERPNLRFEKGDILTMIFHREFDIVAAARVLQWIDTDQLAAAMKNLVRALKAGGLLVVLDYDHTAHTWLPEPPVEFRVFFDAFLAWRAANRWHNSIAPQLPELFRSAGLEDVRTTPASEAAGREDGAAGLWPHVVESLGPRIVGAGYLTAEQQKKALVVSRLWMREKMQQQRLALDVVEGRRA
jgi:ubiquinone/menaquinone biosynthesis C-methylase UbiE